jgi:hypothetical protein
VERTTETETGNGKHHEYFALKGSYQKHCGFLDLKTWRSIPREKKTFLSIIVTADIRSITNFQTFKLRDRHHERRAEVLWP